MLKKLLVAAAVSAAIAACSSTKEPEPAPEPAPVASAPVVASAPEVASAPVVSNHNSVYFGFDQYDIKEGYTGIVKANADHLVAAHDAKVQVQGNTDAVGSVEYNLALGQRRADAVKKALIADGASRKQIEAVSNGKLKLLIDSKDREPKNRRSDIVYKAGQPTGYSQDSTGLPMVDESVYSGTVAEGVE
jgi:peptidoglycan-associated lipoprotein